MLVWKNPSVEAILFVKQEGLSDKVHFVQGLSNEELADMYSSATATFFPSKYEGFGLPILESMASGTPVVTCKNSSLEEVGGNAAIYVEPEDIRTMSIWMENFENRCVDYEKIKMACIKQASLFTWEKCAEKTIDVYKKCLESL